MALDGGGGGGGGPVGVGNSFTGAAQALEVSGSFCYAYSGEQTTTNTTEKTFLEFTTGNYLAVIKLQYGSSTDSGVDVKSRTYLNGSNLIELLHAANYDENQDAKIPMKLILPPYTQFKFTLQGQSTQASEWSVWITGRVYRD